MLEQWHIFQNVFHWKQFNFNSQHTGWKFYQPPAHTWKPSLAFHFIFSSKTIFACQILTIFSHTKSSPDLFVTEIAKANFWSSTDWTIACPPPRPPYNRRSCCLSCRLSLLKSFSLLAACLARMAQVFLLFSLIRKKKNIKTPALLYKSLTLVCKPDTFSAKALGKKEPVIFLGRASTKTTIH